MVNCLSSSIRVLAIVVKLDSTWSSTPSTSMHVWDWNVMHGVCKFVREEVSVMVSVRIWEG
jgi:hypothetical protein